MTVFGKWAIAFYGLLILLRAGFLSFAGPILGRLLDSWARGNAMAVLRRDSDSLALILIAAAAIVVAILVIVRIVKGHDSRGWMTVSLCLGAVWLAVALASGMPPTDNPFSWFFHAVVWSSIAINGTFLLGIEFLIRVLAGRHHRSLSPAPGG